MSDRQGSLTVMGWLIDTDATIGTHEGWAQVLDADGNVIANGSSDKGIAERCDREGAYWRATDEDGWVSPVLHPIPPQAPDKIDPPDHIEARLRDEWEQHVYALHPLSRVEMLTRQAEWLVEQQRAVAAELGQAVTVARGGGASWADIGTAAGVSKQSAWERWGQKS